MKSTDFKDFGTGPHSQHEHPTVHNMSPVEGDSGPPAEHENYAKYYGSKAKWHYDRFGKHPAASLAKAGLYDFRSQVAKGYPK